MDIKTINKLAWWINSREKRNKFRNALMLKEIQKKLNIDLSNFIIPTNSHLIAQINDIFNLDIYNFTSTTDSPVIYDCGASIGVSILYFKYLYPNAKIKGFEADKAIFDILHNNTSFIDGVELYNNAVWINYDELNFNSDFSNSKSGGDGGSLFNNVGPKILVKAIRLKDFLEKETSIDFLKIDIEGAETFVIEDSEDMLHKVNNMFIEYHTLDTGHNLDKLLYVISKAGFDYCIENISDIKRSPFLSMTDSKMQLHIYCYRHK